MPDRGVVSRMHVSSPADAVVHAYPVSTTHNAVQPSPFSVLPSSHASGSCFTPLPHTGPPELAPEIVTVSSEMEPRRPPQP
eukprot:1379171-Rhodomonas_salina.2